ncbi:MAG: oxygen-independent coproporphyrinogen III oxidase [Flavobacteriales bacterium]|nr:oxygen-independent coproporphyrinogen III oxidase [Flavobacteriales bacterium]
MNTELIRKYNVPTPRYTSYPTVPHWDESTFKPENYLADIARSSATDKGISLYIHLPYCESLCTYCGCNKRITKNHAVELPYIDAVLREWKMYADLMGGKPKISELHLGGGTPTFFKPESLKKLIDGIREQGEFTPNADLSFEAHPNNTSEKHLATLRLLGFKRLSLGIQDFDPVVQLTINRIQPFGRVRQVCEAAQKANYHSINMDLIYGLPKQKLESVINTVKKVLVLKPDRIALYSYAHVPWKSPSQRGYDESDLPTDEQKLNLFITARNMFTEAGYISIGMDHFALPHDDLAIAQTKGELHRNFMGYTPQKTDIMIGLGVSSIGDNTHSMGQNEKNVEAYLERIVSGQFPIIKGHSLTKEDKEIREAITKLMCQYHFENGPLNNREYLKIVTDRLAEPIADGLLEITESGIRVNKKGTPFIRNICMALDQRYWASNPKGNMFSSSI